MTRTILARYCVAAAAVGFVLVIKTPIELWVGSGPPLILFIPALTFSAWFGGMGPGMLATVLSVLSCNYLYFPPIGSLMVESGYDRVQLGVFVLEGILTSVLMQQLIDAKRQSETSAAETEAYRDTLQQSEA
jgi:K+-sensing histidine kinase KdpD